MADHAPARRRTLLAASGAAAALLAASADAQSRRMMVMEQDGPTGQVMHLSLPDMQELRTPDFVLADLPDFNTELVLTDTQQPVVEDLLREYLASFDALRVEFLPAQERVMFGGGPMILGEMHDPDHDPGDHGDNVFFLDGAHDLTVDEDIVGNGGTISIAISAGAGGGGDEGAGGVWVGGGGGDVVLNEGDAGVAIELNTEDGEISEETRKQLEEHAQKMMERLQERLEEMEANPDAFAAEDLVGDIESRMASMEELVESAEKFEAAKANLKAQFVASVQSTITDDQLEQWPALDRTLTRRKTLPKGRINGERTDLVQVLDAIEVDAATNPELAEQVEAYEIALHDALVRRNNYVKDATEKVDEAMAAQDTDEALKIVDRATALRLAVKQVNTSYAAAIREHLDEAKTESFNEAIRKRSYPRVYRKTRGLRTFEAARKIDGIDDETLMAVLELETNFRRELDLVNDEIRRAIDEHQPHDSRRAIAAIGDGGMSFSHDENPVHQAYDKRRALEAKHIDLLKNVLTPEQVEQLPKAPRQRGFQPIILRRSTGGGSN